MPLVHQFTMRHAAIAIWHITESETQLLSLLPQDAHYAQAVGHFGSEARRKEWLACRCLLHNMLGTSVRIAYQPTGKPMLEGNDQRHVSLSHSHAMACIAVSDSDIGVDIERNSARPLRLSSHFLSAEEQQLGQEDAEQMATMLWCAKEATYKLANVPGLSLKREIRITVSDTGKHLCAHIPYTPHNIGLEFCTYTHYTIALAFAKE